MIDADVLQGPNCLLDYLRVTAAQSIDNDGQPFLIDDMK